MNTAVKFVPLFSYVQVSRATNKIKLDPLTINAYSNQQHSKTLTESTTMMSVTDKD